MNRIKQYILAVSIMAGGLFVAAAPATLTYADQTPTQAACAALGSAKCNDTSGGPSLNKIITTVINILSMVIGIIAVIMIIIGALRYITSNGDSNSISGAKNTIIYAVIGLVIAAMAQLLVQFVLNKVAS